jgi:hypothetical protein
MCGRICRSHSRQGEPVDPDFDLELQSGWLTPRRFSKGEALPSLVPRLQLRGSDTTLYGRTKCMPFWQDQAKINTGVCSGMLLPSSWRASEPAPSRDAYPRALIRRA